MSSSVLEDGTGNHFTQHRAPADLLAQVLMSKGNTSADCILCAGSIPTKVESLHTVSF